MNILIADPTDGKARQYLKDNGFICIYKPKITADELEKEIEQAHALLVRSRTKVTQNLLKKGKNLKVVARVGSGFDNINIEASRKCNIVVVNAPDANSQSVAEMTVGLMISLCRHLTIAAASMENGLWIKDRLWGSELSGKTIGIVGYGHVGKRVVKILKAFGVKILLYSKSDQNCSLEELFGKSDIVSLHLALNSQTKGLITASLLAKMKSSSYLLNLSRAAVVDEEALFAVLSAKKIAGGALDVFWQEPLPANSRWRKLNNVILTPHIGAATSEALQRASLTVAEDIVRVLRGEKAKYQISL